MDLQFYIKNISRCLGIADILSKGDNIISVTLSSSMKLFLKINYLKIKSTFNNNLTFKQK